MATRTGLGFLFGFLLLLAAGTARAQSVAVKTGEHDGTSRVVFEFPKLVAYHVLKTGTGVELTFDTPLDAASPGDLPPLVAAFSASKPDAGQLKAVMTLKPGARYRHYRLLKKIVVDVSASPAKAQEEPPKETPEKTAAAPPKEPPPAPAPEKPVASGTKDEAPAPAAAPVAPVAAEAVPPPAAPETTITISTVSPTKIAVFTRFGYLWIVADRDVSNAFTPPVEGALAQVLGKPKFFKFGEGRAWRYAMPPGRYHLHVTKKLLNWRVHLADAPVSKTLPVSANVDVDPAANTARLMAQLPGASEVIPFEDPSAGDLLHVVATDRDDMRVETSRVLPDAEIIPADMGFVVKPLRDGVETRRLGDYVTVTAPGGLTVTSGVASSVSATGGEEGEAYADTLFDFPDWRMGGIEELYKNKRELMQKIAAAETQDEKHAQYMKLARLYFANNFGKETLGVLDVIESENEDMAKTSEFIALKGAASAMAGHYPEALKFLSNPAIQQHPEVNLWIGYAAAATEQWRKASASFPKGNRLLVKYPDNIAIPFTLYMAESALRLGRAETAGALLGSVSETSEEFLPQYRSALGYLRGEMARQQKDIDGAVRAWQPVAAGIDRLYHAKASLALANLLLQEGKMTLKEAIDQVDSLRFAWRGDGLEVQILQNLGDLKIRDGQYLSGLQDLKQAAALAETQLDDPAPIHDLIRRTFSSLYVEGAAEKIAPLEAVSIYNEFNGLVPPGEESARANLHFADYLVRMDLLPAAEAIFETHLKNGTVPDAEVAATGARLAALYLLDAKPQAALKALDASARGGDAKTAEERALLRARAQADSRQVEAAITTLSALSSKDAQKLKVDVLWRARQWAAASDALLPLLPDPAKKIGDEDARAVLNAAVAAKLAGDGPRLDDIKARYGRGMADTKLSSAFGVVTREGGASELSDRDSLLKMAGEVDMFKGFLDAYKAGEAKVQVKEAKTEINEAKPPVEAAKPAPEPPQEEKKAE